MKNNKETVTRKRSEFCAQYLLSSKYDEIENLRKEILKPQQDLINADTEGFQRGYDVATKKYGGNK